MAKIVNKDQLIFCGASGASGILGQFGSMKLGTKLYTSNLDIIQNLDAYGAGLNSALINAAPPTIQEFNSLCYMLSRQVAYLQQHGIPEWNSSTTYYKGSIVAAEYIPADRAYINTRVTPTFGAWYVSVTDNNLNNALSDTDHWMIIFDVKVTSISNTTEGYEYTVLYSDYRLYLSHGASDEVSMTCILPYPEASYAGRILHVSVNPAAGTYNFRTTQLNGNYGYIDNVTTWECVPTSKTTLGGLSMPTVFSFICDGSKWWMFNARNVTHSHNN